MMTITEKVAYLRGLVEGMKLDEDKDEVKIINAIVDVLDDMALSVADLEDEVASVEEIVDEIDEDLGDLEDYIVDEFDDYCDGDCEGCDGCDDYEDYDEDEDFFEVTCPSCNETITINGEILEEGGIECPNCGEQLEFDIDFDEED